MKGKEKWEIQQFQLEISILISQELILKYLSKDIKALNIVANLV